MTSFESRYKFFLTELRIQYSCFFVPAKRVYFCTRETNISERLTKKTKKDISNQILYFIPLRQE